MMFYKLLFFATLILGSLITISAYSWMSMWMGLEINLLSIIPLLSSVKNIYPSESALKYFITQALASSLLLFSIIMLFNTNEFFPQNSNMWMMVMNSALLTKVGAAPFHAWFPEVIEGLSWMNCLMLLTWQKIAPFILIMYNCKMSLFLSVIIIFSSIIGGIMGINQISLRKILAYSSINHIAWMLSSILSLKSIWLIYFLVYSIITINIIIIFNNLNIFYLKQMFNLMNQNKHLKFMFILNFMSLGGLPPFLGFFPKWLVINSLTQNNFLTTSIILIITTLIALFFYLRITFSVMVINTTESMNFKSTSLGNYLTFWANFMSLSGIIICTLIFSLF